MKNKLKKLGISLLVVLFWLGVWDLCALAIGLDFVLPTVNDTALSLLDLLGMEGFYLSVFSSLWRIFSSFLLGVIIAAFLAVVVIRFPIFKALLSPVMTVAKSTPVAVIIIILWLMIGGAKVPGAIALLMVVPIIYQNLLDGYDAIDRQLEEVCLVNQFGFFKRLRLLVLPTMLKFLFPGIITASGLAWKSGIAAEIICMTKNSIGKEIYNAKYMLDGPKMFAYTIFVLLLSYAIERLIKHVVEGVKNRCRL